jgi:hypothetical protein
MPDWQKATVVEGVCRARSGASPEELHEEWCKDMRAMGWVYGPVKDKVSKTHPCLLEWESLSPAQREKDRMFQAAVSLLSMQ